MKKILQTSFFVALAASFFWFIPNASARPCGSGSKGNCSWSCSGGTFEVKCDNPGGPDRCYIVNGNGTRSAKCGPPMEAYGRVIPGGLNAIINKIAAAKTKVKGVVKPGGNKVHGKKVNKKAATCKKYAYASRAQQYANLRSRCGYRGYGWSKDLKRHHKWCMKVSASTAKRMYNFRKAALGRCAKKAHACRRYATTARSQQYANLKAKCGYRGYAWSTNYIHHFAWCMRVSFRTSATATKNRALALRKCFSKRKRK